MDLQKTSAEIVNQLISISTQLDNAEFTQPLELLSGNSIGKHIRHIIEFYDCLIRGYESDQIDYDTRAHNSLFESNKLVAINEMDKIIEALDRYQDKPLKLLASYCDDAKKHLTATSFNRELVYNIEHATHHMAIINIAMRNAFPKINLPANFGVAYSTIKYQQQCAQ